MGEMIDVDVHMRSPFDPKNRRLQGFYGEDELIGQTVTAHSS